MPALPPVSRDYDLRALNTFHLAHKAHAYCEVRSVEELRAILFHAQYRHLPRLILGGGSNILLRGDFPGLVVQLRLLGKRESAAEGLLEAAAGENWHEFVLWSLAQGWCGLENLSLIPGSVGASPLQNIGAYGVEMRDCFHELTALDLATGALRRFDAAACEFGYRDSVFKRALKQRTVITSVTFRLARNAPLHLDYGELKAELQRMAIAAPSARDVSTAVTNVRRRKLPDPAQIGNAGSFFKNPVVDLSVAQALAERYPALPRYPAERGKVKLAAGWLIEQAGWKGKRRGNAGVHANHALVLVNLGGATGEEILDLAREIQDAVEQKFGLRLEPEIEIV